MTNHGTKELTWKDNKLYYDGEVVYSVVKDRKYPVLYRMKAPDGKLSEDFYNLTRACDNCVFLTLQRLNQTEDLDLDSQQRL